jgi:hypothetical protein
MWYAAILFILFILLALIIAFILDKYNISYIGGNNISYIGGNKKDTIFDSKLFQFKYTLSGETNGLDFSVLREILKQNNFIECSVKEKVHCSFGNIGSGVLTDRGTKWDLSLYIIQQYAAIKNLIDYNNVINKMELYKTIRRLIPLGVEFIPETHTIEEFEAIYSSIFGMAEGGYAGVKANGDAGVKETGYAGVKASGDAGVKGGGIPPIYIKKKQF